MAYKDGRSIDSDRKKDSSYDECINSAKSARDSQRRDTDPMIQKEGYLGVDDLDRMRRRKIGKIF